MTTLLEKEGVEGGSELQRQIDAAVGIRSGPGVGSDLAHMWAFIGERLGDNRRVVLRFRLRYLLRRPRGNYRVIIRGRRFLLQNFHGLGSSTVWGVDKSWKRSGHPLSIPRRPGYDQDRAIVRWIWEVVFTRSYVDADADAENDVERAPLAKSA